MFYKVKNLVLLFTLISSVSLLAKDGYTIEDFYKKTKLNYTSKFIELKKSKFNLYDRIEMNYPVLTQDTEHTNVETLNRKLYYYVVSYLETDTFKLELLQHAKNSMEVLINNPETRQEYNLYTRNNYEKLLPEITQIDYKFNFLFDDILAVQISYRYSLGIKGYSVGDDFFYHKSYFISLKNNKTYFLKDILDPSKIKVFEENLKSRLPEKIHPKQNSPEENRIYIESSTDEYEESEEDFNVRDNSNTKENFKLNLDDLVFNLLPIGAQFILPQYSRSFGSDYAEFIQLYYNAEEVKDFISSTGPLKSYKTYSLPLKTNLKNINIYKEIRISWRDLELQQSTPFRTAPMKGIKSITKFYVSPKTIGDTSSLTTQTIYSFAADGKLIKEEYPGSGKNRKVYTYDNFRRLSKIESFDYEKTEKTQFEYDRNGNLKEHLEISETEGNTTHRYFYEGNKVYELILSTRMSQNLKEPFTLNIYILNDFGRIETRFTFNQEPNYFNIYEKDNLLASYNKNYPTLDNSVYCYDNKDKILTIQYDNNRHFYEYKYDSNGRLIKQLHFDSDYLKDKKEYFYNEKGLLVKYINYEGMYSFDLTNNLHTYKFDYEFY